MASFRTQAKRLSGKRSSHWDTRSYLKCLKSIQRWVGRAILRGRMSPTSLQITRISYRVPFKKANSNIFLTLLNYIGQGNEPCEVWDPQLIWAWVAGKQFTFISIVVNKAYTFGSKSNKGFRHVKLYSSMVISLYWIKTNKEYILLVW